MLVLNLISILLTSTAALAAPAPATPVVDIGARTFAGSAESLSGITYPAPVAPHQPRTATTNAYRLRRGLTPLPPKRRSTGTARRSTPSTTPQITKRALIQVNKVSDGQLLGFVAKTATGPYFYTPTDSSAMTVAINVNAGATSVSMIDISIVDGSASFPFFGLGISNVASNEVRTGSYRTGLFVATNQTPPGSTPGTVGNSDSAREQTSESAVWDINLTNGALTHHWINNDGTKAPTTGFVSGNSWLYFSGDLAAFNRVNSNRGQEIRFTFVEKA